MSTAITLPEMGEGVIEGTVTRWLVAEGDTVEQFDPVAEIETDKVTTETTSEVDGTVLKIIVGAGETVPVGAVLAYVGQPGEEVGTTEQSLAAGNGSEATAPDRPPVYSGRVSPLVGRIAGEHNIDLAQVEGTGRDGRVTKKDVLAYIEARKNDAEPAAARTAAAAATPTSLAEGGDELQPVSSIRRTIAERMVDSVRRSPHVTTIFEVDFSAVERHRQQHKDSFARDGVRLTYTAYIVTATAQALKEHPRVNSVWTEDGLLLKQAINIGLAVAIDSGLIVPVIRNADQLNLRGLARKVNDVTGRARENALQPQEVQGGTFTITNHGTSGSLLATPIINQPQCAILGVGKIERRVTVVGDAIAIRPLAYLGLTFDHRILDGAAGDAFLASIKRTLEDWR